VERAHDGRRAECGAERWCAERVRCALPAITGLAELGDATASRPVLLTENLAGLARARAKAQRVSSPELCFGGEHACHRREIVTDHNARVNPFSRAHSAPDPRPLHRRTTANTVCITS
jgi:hypothetical protein